MLGNDVEQNGLNRAPTTPDYMDVLAPQSGDSSVTKSKTKQKKSSKLRSLKACSTCRGKKTKCFPSSNSIACFRCSFHGIICSFEKDAISNDRLLVHEASSDKGTPSMLGTSNALVDSRLKMLQGDVNEILNLLKNHNGSIGSDSNDPLGTNGRGVQKQHNRQQQSLEGENHSEVTPLTDVTTVKLFRYGNTVVDLANLPSFGELTSAFKTAPFKTFTEFSRPYQISTPISKFMANEKTLQFHNDLISLGLLSFEEALNLLQNFRDRYGRWVSFPEEMPSEVLLMNIRKNSSLLLTCCCALSLRYGDISLKRRVYDQVLSRLHVELNENLSKVPQSLEFLQSMVILSLYGICISSNELTIDSWYISGIALQHFLSKDLSGQLFDEENIPTYMDNEFYKLSVYRIWNHLSLVHLVYCIFTGRMCIVDDLRLSLSRKILELVNSTNFDGRIVAEISCQLIVYNFVQFANGQQSLQNVKEELSNWYDQWSYLFEQPTNQFVGLGYHYGYLLILYNWNFKKLEKKNGEQDLSELLLEVDSISMRNMIFHCQKIIEAMLDTHNDSYFAFLSDQVHFSCNFGINILLRILHVLTSLNYATTGDDLNRVEISQKELQKNLSNCLKLSKRYKKVCAGEDDIFMKYHLAINSALGDLFPDFDKS